MHVGERIRQLRKERNITAEQLAVKLNKGSATIVHWERGETSPRVDDVIDVADAIGVDLAKLVKGITRSRAA